MKNITNEVKQVFASYNYLEQQPDVRGFRFCPQCGSGMTLCEVDGKKRATCSRCGFIHYQNPAPCVSLLIVEAEKVLLVKRGGGNYLADKWCLPCGFMEYDEDFLSAAIREAEEETGLSVRIESILSVVSNFHTPGLHSLVVVLLARVVGGLLSPGDDVVACEWVPLSGPYPELAFVADQHILERFSQTCLQGVPVDPDYAGC
ncbi:MAG TPA: NUDIX hydrolase [Bacillota bacterium]|nr:NUDIX hydrolase [Bacillota bacterium]